VGFGGEKPHGQSEVNEVFIKHAGGLLVKLSRAFEVVGCGLPARRRRVFIPSRKVTVPKRALSSMVSHPSFSAHYVAFSHFHTRNRCKSTGKQ
jgi:hypothetical protein